MTNQQTYQQMQEIQSELSLFLKRVRQREDDHYRLLDYTSKILAKRSQPEQSIDLLNQISKSKDFLKQRLSIDIIHQEKDLSLASKCESFSFEEEDSLLTRRVTARILEVTFNAIELRRQSNEYYSATYSKFKENCLKGLTEIHAKPAWIIKTTNRYLTQKLQVQLQRLRLTLVFMEKNDFQSLNKHRSSYYSQLKTKELQLTFIQKRQKVQRPSKLQIPHQNQKDLKKQQQNENPQKQQKKQIIIRRSKAKSSKEEQKQSLKLKKIEAKKLKRFAASLSEVMDICKEDFLQQLAPQNKAWQTRRMLHDLLTRNKNNQSYINIFRQKQEQLKELFTNDPACKSIGKTNLSRCQSLQEELLQKNKRQQLQVIAFNAKEIRVSEQNLQKKDAASVTQYDKKEVNRLIPKTGNIKVSNPRQRSTLNSIQESQKIKKQRQIFSSQKQILPQPQFVQINFKAPMPLPKARFPQIYSRGNPVEKTHLIKKQQAIRTKIQLKTTTNNFFEEIEKRVSKFCQMKKSLLV